jgi:CheY-like chemotaxis protein
MRASRRSPSPTPEEDAIASALETRPDIITSEVKLIKGTGPSAVDRIHQQLGTIPVIFITATPQDCDHCEPPGVVLAKPIDARAVIRSFHEVQA